MTKVADGATYDSNNTYYSMDTDATVPAASKVYAYAEQETVGGETEFRFIGKLSTGKQSGWTAADFSAITIAYDVTGVQASAYDEVKDDCVRGLYTAPTAPSIATADQTKTLARDTEVTIPVNLGSGSLKANGVKTVTLKGQTANLITAKYVSYSEGKITIPATAVNAMIASPDTYLPGGKAVLVVTFDDAAETPVEITVNAPAAASTP